MFSFSQWHRNSSAWATQNGSIRAPFSSRNSEFKEKVHDVRNGIYFLSSNVHKKTEIDRKQMISSLHLPWQYVLLKSRYCFSILLVASNVLGWRGWEPRRIRGRAMNPSHPSPCLVQIFWDLDKISYKRQPFPSFGVKFLNLEWRGIPIFPKTSPKLNRPLDS